MRSLALPILCATSLLGCSFEGARVEAGDGDADGDGGPSACEASAWQPPPTHFEACDIFAFRRALDLDGPHIFNTTTGKLTDPGIGEIDIDTISFTQDNGSEVLVLAVESFRLENGATMRVTGTRALLIAAWDGIEIIGTIDASSIGPGTEILTRGAGALPSCDTPSGGSALGQAGCGGGAGGSRGSLGGDGGSVAGGIGGVAVARVVDSIVIAGGCPGGLSQCSTVDSSAPGAGGGAIHLAARRALKVSGEIRVSGAGGKGGTAAAGVAGHCGGAGGGSGGYIGLEAPTIARTGALVVSGGGGAGGSSNLVAGMPGEDGAANGGGPGGQGGSNGGGDGGAGASGDGGAGATGQGGLTGSDGGGGGGGGQGVVVVYGGPSTSR